MSQRPSLAVILGAGASFDVCPYPGLFKQEGKWRPPLVETLFEGTRCIFDGEARIYHEFDEALQMHPEAAKIMSSVRSEMDSSGGASFEQSLRRLMDSSVPHIRYQMRFVPIALHEFFYRVSHSYTTEAANYSTLVNSTVGLGIQTAFITLNYDTLLEQVLSVGTVSKPDFSTPESYVSADDWILVKLHGSVGWGYPWPTASSIADAKMAAAAFEPPQPDPASIRVGLRNINMFEGGILHYPALALPVAGKYGFVCPPGPLAALEDFLAGCESFLFVGFSARDNDLLDFLKANIREVRRLRIVTREGDLDDFVMNLHAVPQFRRLLAGLLDSHVASSFTDFVRNGLQPLAGSIVSDGASP